MACRECAHESYTTAVAGSWVSKTQPVRCPQMIWGKALDNALKSKGISKEFDEWFAIAKDTPKWRPQAHCIPKPPDAWSLEGTSSVNNYYCFTQKGIQPGQTCSDICRIM